MFGDGRRAHHDPERFRKALSEFYLRRNQSEVLVELPEVIAIDELIDVGEHERLACKQALTNRNLPRAREALTIGAGPQSEKILRLTEIIDECRAENHKVLVFSEFRDVLTTVEDAIGPHCVTIHGDVPKPALPDIIQAFHDAPDFAALAIQIRVGGVGLNLQSASVVVLMEPQLKPSTEWQAVARAHRMGQTRRVVVYRLVAERSADERIIEITQFKAELFDKLARHSLLAEASLTARDHRIQEPPLLAHERNRFGLPTDS
jgi:SNF2 family DNA or RNA helicase